MPPSLLHEKKEGRDGPDLQDEYGMNGIGRSVSHTVDISRLFTARKHPLL